MLGMGSLRAACVCVSVSVVLSSSRRLSSSFLRSSSVSILLLLLREAPGYFDDESGIIVDWDFKAPGGGGSSLGCSARKPWERTQGPYLQQELVY
mmetsp:Transcript_45375/g.131371  ORF Transcript_45375/g.131371 Transcript_45375/m.131371 type:complete len:95 (+) Transcript_45375:72-356(+)